jgi:hypothetical protein
MEMRCVGNTVHRSNKKLIHHFVTADHGRNASDEGKDTRELLKWGVLTCTNPE